jgi:DNA-binding NarL/FixJ family response regulator
VTAERVTAQRFVDDLLRLGAVEHLVAPAPPAPTLGERERQLLALIGRGISVAEAARQLGVDRRTAERRLAAARRTLGVASNAEAVVAALALRH